MRCPDGFYRGCDFMGCDQYLSGRDHCAWKNAAAAAPEEDDATAAHPEPKLDGDSTIVTDSQEAAE